MDVFNLGNGKATNGNDTYVAADHNMTTGSVQPIFGLGDDIDGGAGTNKLVVLGDISLGTIQLAKFANIQQAELTSDSIGATTADLSSVVAGGLQQVTVVEGGGVTVNNINKSITAGVKGAALAGDAGVVFNYTNATTPADAATLTLEGATGALGAARGVTTASIENLTVQASGVSNVALQDVSLQSLTLEAAGRTTLTLASGAVAKIDASASTANTNIDASVRGTLLGGGSVLDYKGGSGDDRIVVSDATFINVNSKFAGGEGSDNLVLNATFDIINDGDTGESGASVAAQLAAINKLDGFEQFTVRGAGNAADINAGAVTSVKKFGFENTGFIDLSNVSNDNSFVVNGVLNTTMTTVAMKTGQTVLNLDVNSSAAGAGLETVILQDVQTLNLSSNKTAANHAANQLVDVLNFSTTNFTVKVTGEQDLVLGNTAKNPTDFTGAGDFDGFSNKVNIDAGAFTGRLTAYGSGDNDVIKGGAGNDTIRGGHGADELTGNGGNDTFVFAFGGATTAGVPATPEIHDLTVAPGATLVAGGTAVNAVNFNGTVYTFTAGATVAATAAAIQAAIRAGEGNDNVSVTAINGSLLRVTDASGAEITALDLRNDAAAKVDPETDDDIAVTPGTTGSALVPAVASETTLQFGSAGNVVDTDEVTIEIGGNSYSASSLAGSSIAQIAAALQTAIQNDLANPLAGVTVTVVDATTLKVTDADGHDIDEGTFTLEDAGTAAVPPTDISGISMVEHTPADPGNTNAVSDINFGAANDIAATASLAFEVNGTNVQVVVPAGSNINAIAAAIQSAMVTDGFNLATATVLDPLTIRIDSGDDSVEIAEATFSAQNAGSPAIPPAPITVGVLATQVAEGSAEVPAVPDTYTFDYGTGNDVTNITLTVDGKELNVDVSATATDAQVVVALNAAWNTAGGAGSIFSDTTPGTTTDGDITITVPFGTVVSDTVSATTKGSAQVDGTPDSGATSVEFQDGTPEVPGAGEVSSESNITALDTITDFVKGADKIDLVSFDNFDLGAPSKAWFAGDVTATAGANNLAGALALAISDVNGASQTGSVALGANEAVFFMYGGNTYVLVNDADAGYSATNDVLIKLTGSMGLTEGAVNVADFFA